MAPLEEALVGEIVLRYTYPTTRKMAPMEVPNPNGTAHGPPGTQVELRARTADSFETASLRVLEEQPVQAELLGGRDLKAGFVLSEAGTYQFHLTRSQQKHLSQEFAIEIEPDHAPTVELQSSSDRIEVEYNKRLPLAWSARDDFGLDKVVAVVGEEEIAIRDP